MATDIGTGAATGTERSGIAITAPTPDGTMIATTGGVDGSAQAPNVGIESLDREHMVSERPPDG